MQIIAHRVNTVQALHALPAHYGVEMDLHAYAKALTVHHDPFVEGERFETWLDAYRHKTLVLNIKEEGIEPAVLEAVQRRGIEDFFLLDVSPPVLMRLLREGEPRVAVRVSAVESVETALALRGKARWAFIDVMEEGPLFPLAPEEYRALKEAGYKLCLVSHDVWGRGEAKAAEQHEYLIAHGYGCDAVLTKYPRVWER